MSARARADRLTLRRPVPAPVAQERPSPTLVETAPMAEPLKVKGPARVPRAWRPAQTIPTLRQQLPSLLADGVDIPAVFAADPVPLAIHSDRELLTLAREGRRSRLRSWIHAWCSRWPYSVQVASPGAWRHDLDGNPVEAVTAEQRAHAAARLAERLCRTRR